MGVRWVRILLCPYHEEEENEYCTEIGNTAIYFTGYGGSSNFPPSNDYVLGIYAPTR
jgi:hypothetical protein